MSLINFVSFSFNLCVFAVFSKCSVSKSKYIWSCVVDIIPFTFFLITSFGNTSTICIFLSCRVLACLMYVLTLNHSPGVKEPIFGATFTIKSPPKSPGPVAEINTLVNNIPAKKSAGSCAFAISVAKELKSKPRALIMVSPNGKANKTSVIKFDISTAFCATPSSDKSVHSPSASKLLASIPIADRSRVLKVIAVVGPAFIRVSPFAKPACVSILPVSLFWIFNTSISVNKFSSIKFKFLSSVLLIDILRKSSLSNSTSCFLSNNT